MNSIMRADGHATITRSTDGQELTITPDGDAPIAVSYIGAEGVKMFRYDPGAGWTQIQIPDSDPPADRPPPVRH